MFHRKSLLERFQEDYTAAIVPSQNKDGFRIDYVYYASWFLWDESPDALKRHKWKILFKCLGCVVALLLNMAAGSELNTLRLVAYPALLALCVFVFELVGVGQFFFARYKTTRATFEEANRRLRVCTAAHAVLSAAAAIACAGYMVRLGGSLPEGITLCCYAAQAALSLLIRSEYVRIPFTTERNTALDHLERVTLK